MFGAIFFALIAYFGWALSDSLAGLLSRKLDSTSGVVWTFIIRISLYTLLIPLFLNEAKNITFPLLVLGLGIGCLVVISYLFFYESIRLINPALSGSIALSWGVVSLLISLIFFKEQLNFIQSLSVILIIFGLLLSSFSIEFLKENKINRKGIFYSFLTMIGWGIVGALLKFPIQKIGWFWTTYLQILPFVIILFVYKAKNAIILPIKNMKILTLTIIIAFLVFAAELSYNIGLSKGLVSIVAPIAGSYATLMVPLSYLLFKDPVKMQQKAGMLMSLIGIVLLSFMTK